MGDVSLARVLWSHVDNPLHCALLASNLLWRLSNTVTAGKREAEEAAEEIELWAVGVLNEVQEVHDLPTSPHISPHLRLLV